MALSGKSYDMMEQVKACDQALIELETQAGIAEIAEKVRSEPPFYLGVHDAAERHSDEFSKLVDAEHTSHEKRITRNIRELYFNVPDVNLRKQLIAKEREVGNLVLQRCQEELNEAAAELKAARSSRQYWWVYASVAGATFITVGFIFFGLIGGLAGLLIGFFLGRQLEHETRRSREEEVKEAERVLKEREQNWNEERNEPQTFSQREAKTGEPDPDQIARLRKNATA